MATSNQLPTSLSRNQCEALVQLPADHFRGLGRRLRALVGGGFHCLLELNSWLHGKAVWIKVASTCWSLVLGSILFIHQAGFLSTPLFVPAKLESITQADQFSQALWGIAVADEATGEILFEQNGHTFFAPGSTAKLFSAAAALDAFGPDYRFVTNVYRTGDITKHGQLQGDLILRAAGDPDFGGRVSPSGQIAFANIDHIYSGTTDAAYLPNANPMSGLEDLAAQIAAAGVREVRDVLVDDRLFDHSRGGGTGPSTITPIVINDNVIDVTIYPGDEVGTPAEVFVSPTVPYLQVTCSVKTVKHDSTLVLVREVGPDHFVVMGRIAQGRGPLLRIAEVRDPTKFARALLIQRLQDHGIRVRHSLLTTVARKSLPNVEEYDHMSVIARNVSLPFSDTIRIILKASHNLHANMLPLLVATRNHERSLTTGMTIEREFLKRAGIGENSVSVFDGSGATPSRVTPLAVTAFLCAMSKRPDFRYYKESLPIMGKDGTLVNALPYYSPARGKIYAKTGTWFDRRQLVMTKGLAGYITSESGRKLVFAIYVTNVPIKMWRYRIGLGLALAKLAELFYVSF